MATTRVSATATLVVAALLVVGCGDDGATDVGSGGADAGTEPADETGAEPLEELVDDTGAEPVEEPADEPAEAPVAGDGLFPDVVDAVITPRGDGIYTVDATLSSPYDSAARYADAWRVLAPDGTVLGARELLHDHAGEQPFTRSLSGVEIGVDVAEVTIEGRDQLNGWGGATVTVEVPR